jgi:type VII secretion protein EccB
MASKRDQLHAYQFLAQRVVSALVTRESDPEQPPFRRPSNSAFASIALAVIALAAVGVYGFIVPGGNKSWRSGESVIVEKETGTRHIYLDGRLHPVANYTSALLLLGQHASTVSVSRKSLVDVPRGPRIGIPDAPDALPGRDRVLAGSWSLCSQPVKDLSGAVVTESVLLAGLSPRGGAAVGDAALLVEVPATRDWHLIWHGYRHRISQADTTVVGLALRTVPRISVGMALVDNLPAGPSIGPIPLPDMGQPSAALPGRPDLRVGQLLVVQTSGVQYYLADAELLRPISPLQYDIQRAYRPTSDAYAGGDPVAIPLSPLGLSSARVAPVAPASADQAPATRTAFAGGGDTNVPVCATFDSGATVPRLTVAPDLPPSDPISATPRRTETGLPLADRVVVPPGSAIVVEAMPSPQAQAGTVVVVTDLGRSHPIASRDILGVLGFDGVQPVRMPAGLVARIPLGSGLDPAVAKNQAP